MATNAYDPTDLVGQADSKQEAEAREHVLRETEIADVKWLMSSDRGRRFMYRVLEISGVFNISFDPNAMKMAFNEGKRNFGNRLFHQLMTVCPEQVPAMLKERQDGSKRDSDGRKQK